jgi:hypothetical protein
MKLQAQPGYQQKRVYSMNISDIKQFYFLSILWTLSPMFIADSLSDNVYSRPKPNLCLMDLYFVRRRLDFPFPYTYSAPL